MNNRSKRQSIARVFTVLLAALLCFSQLGIFIGCEPAEPPGPLTPPTETPKVHSVVMTYNDAEIEGLLSVDIALGGITVSATVNKDEGAEGSLSYESSDEKVATIDKDGNVDFVSAGETVLTAKYGSESCSIVLSVESSFVEKYAVTVIDGKASASTAAEGDIITVTPTIPAHKEFEDWSFADSTTSVTWVSGNMFKMPAGDVTVKAEFTDMLYSLRLVGAKVTEDGSEEVQEGELIGYDGTVESEEYAIREYKYPYEAKLSFEAIDPPEGKMFVGWDENVANNRIDAEEAIADYVMPDETTTLWANFSTFTTKELLQPTGILGSWNPIEIDGASADPELEGLSGYTFNIPAGTTRMEGYNEDIHGSILDTTNKPSQAIRAIFRNRGRQPVTVEIYASYLTNIATSGLVTIQPGETVSKTFIALLGFSTNPWWGFSVRETTTTEGGDVPLDIVMGCANAYPKGDKTLAVSSGTRLVQLDNYTATLGTAFTTRVDNTQGWTLVATYEHSNGLVAPAVVTARLNNLPAYDPADPYITLYIKMQNQAASDHSYNYMFAFGKDAVPLDDDMQLKDGTKAVDFTVYNQGETKLFAIRLPREAADQFYFSIIKLKYDTPDNVPPESVQPYYAMNFSVVLTYNNGIGFTGEVTE